MSDLVGNPRRPVFSERGSFTFYRVKDAIKQRKHTVAYKWRKAAVQARFQKALSNTGRDSADGRPTSNLSLQDAVMIVSKTNPKSTDINGGASAKM